jgi:HSP20 family molecular chaperone IbpA
MNLMDIGSYSWLGNLISKSPPPVRDLLSGEAPEWGRPVSDSPSHYLGPQAHLAQSRVVPLDVYHIQTSGRQIMITAELPGLAASEVFFAVDQGLLTICSEAVAGANDQGGDPLWALCRDLHRGKFSQTLELPGNLAVDRWSAIFEDGVLRIYIPKTA